MHKNLQPCCGIFSLVVFNFILAFSDFEKKKKINTFSLLGLIADFCILLFSSQHRNFTPTLPMLEFLCF